VGLQVAAAPQRKSTVAKQRVEEKKRVGSLASPWQCSSASESVTSNSTTHFISHYHNHNHHHNHLTSSSSSLHLPSAFYSPLRPFSFPVSTSPVLKRYCSLAARRSRRASPSPSPLSAKPQLPHFRLSHPKSNLRRRASHQINAFAIPRQQLPGILHCWPTDKLSQSRRPCAGRVDSSFRPSSNTLNSTPPPAFDCRTSRNVRRP
jgi:hypothetical protein